MVFRRKLTKLNWNYALQVVGFFPVNSPSLQILCIFSDNLQGTLPVVHPSVLQKWIKFKFRIENTLKANKKITYTAKKQHQTRGVYRKPREPTDFMALAPIVPAALPALRTTPRTPMLFQRWWCGRNSGWAAPSEQLLHKLPHAKQVQKTPSVTEKQECHCNSTKL